MDKVIADLEGFRKIVDDNLIFAPSLPVLEKHTRAFLDQCRHHLVTLKQAKSQLAVTEVNFGGFACRERESKLVLTYWSPLGIFLDQGT